MKVVFVCFLDRRDEFAIKGVEELNNNSIFDFCIHQIIIRGQAQKGIAPIVSVSLIFPKWESMNRK